MCRDAWYHLTLEWSASQAFQLVRHPAVIATGLNGHVVHGWNVCLFCICCYFIGVTIVLFSHPSLLGTVLHTGHFICFPFWLDHWVFSFTGSVICVAKCRWARSHGFTCVVSGRSGHISITDD